MSSLAARGTAFFCRSRIVRARSWPASSISSSGLGGSLSASSAIASTGLLLRRLLLLGQALDLRPRPLHVGVVDLLGHRLGQGHLLVALAGQRGQPLLAELPFEGQGGGHLPRHQAHRPMLHRLLVVEVVDVAVARLADTPGPASGLPHLVQLVARLVEDDAVVVVPALHLREQVEPRADQLGEADHHVELAAVAWRSTPPAPSDRQSSDFMIPTFRPSRSRISLSRGITFRLPVIWQ